MNETDTNLADASAGAAPSEPVPTPAEPAKSVLVGRIAPEHLRDELLAEIFADTVRHRPQHAALETLERIYTYAEVDALATGIARALLARGVRPGDVVGLWMARGPELLIAQIAIAKTGAAWLPFDADAPVDRIAVCLSDAEAKGLLTSAEFALKAEGSMPCPILIDDAIVDPADARDVDARALGATPDHAAYMIYTSGSTGVPKGIVITGRNICHYLRSANELYGVSASDIVFQGASVAFDLSMEEIWIPYLVGATLFVATPQIMGEADKLPDILDDAGVTVLDTVPTLLAMLPKDAPKLRIIILGGEACPPAVAARWCKPGRAIFNSYGPTEATVVATAAIVEPDRPVTIGGPIPNYTAYVCDDMLNLLDRGIEGELLIGGPGVAKGYLKRDELTAEKFVANPFGGATNDPILYRSGDAVVMDEAGNINFRGRIDDQVKIRGFRVELGEIEAKLTDLAGVSQAAVVLRAVDGIDELVAFLTPNKGAELDARQMRGELRANLPPYMVPGRYEILDTLPKLPSGKVNRNLLKKAELKAAAPVEEQEEPRTQTEAALLDAAKRTLPPQAVPFDADFFTDLGGHSLLAARFVSAVRETPRLQPAFLARDLRASRRQGGHGRSGARSFLRAAALHAALPVRSRAGDRPALHSRPDDRAMARRLRQLHAADRSRREPALGNRRAARRLPLHQSRHDPHLHRREMAAARAHEARALSLVGNLLFPLVAGAAPHGALPYQVVPGFADHAALSFGHGREDRRGRAHQRSGSRRDRSRDHRRGRLARHEAEARQRPRRRQ
jgi:amino acid adenylation domain-containing protein